jgi:two-component system response regulator AtoC
MDNMESKKILIVDDEEGMRHMLKLMLEREGYKAVTAEKGEEGLEILEKEIFDLILCDIRMPGMDGMAFLNEIKNRGIESTIIMMSAYGTVDTALEAMKRGAYDYISKPFKTDEVILTLKKAEERERLRRENLMLKGELKKEYQFGNLIAKSEKMLAIFDMIKKVADYNTSILILGESGTGKELIARAIHYNSNRSERPFVAINCGAIPEDLLESEMFGHEKGAFTGAIKTRIGRFEMADGGTILLDEVSDMSPGLQAKLLRVLQEHEFERVGGAHTIKVDIRVIAATARNLSQEVSQGKFREDLFYRLNVIPITLPPLRERKEDIPLLVSHFIRRFNERHGMSIEGMTPRTLKILMDHHWPGNVRELENVIERAMVLAEDTTMKEENLPWELGHKLTEEIGFFPEDLSLKKMQRKWEEKLIRKALEKTKGNKTKAAKLLEISYPWLLTKIKEYGIES